MVAAGKVDFRLRLVDLSEAFGATCLGAKFGLKVGISKKNEVEVTGRIPFWKALLIQAPMEIAPSCARDGS